MMKIRIQAIYFSCTLWTHIKWSRDENTHTGYLIFLQRFCTLLTHIKWSHDENTHTGYLIFLQVCPLLATGDAMTPHVQGNFMCVHAHAHKSNCAGYRPIFIHLFTYSQTHKLTYTHACTHTHTHAHTGQQRTMLHCRLITMLHWTGQSRD